MKPEENNAMIQDKVKKLLRNPVQHKFSGEKRAELIARLYKIEEEKKKIVEFVPFLFKPAFAAAVAMAIVIFGYTHLFSPLYPTVFAAKGNVEIYSSRQKAWAPVEKAKLRLKKGDAVRTAKNSEVDIAIPGLYHMRLKGNSEIRLARTRSRILGDSIGYKLSSGKLFAYCKRIKKPGKRFEIETPEAGLCVTGTGFMVDRALKTQKTWIGVLEGAVKVTGRDIKGPLPRPEMASVLVEAGTKATVEKGRMPEMPARLLKNELLGLEELYRIGEKPQVALLISTGKTRVRELLSFVPLYVSSEVSGVFPVKIKQAAAAFDRAMKTGSREGHINTIKQFEEIVKTHPNPKYNAQFLLFTGAYYEYLDEHEKAIETFRRVIGGYPKSSLSSLAECAIGIIYEEKLGLPDKARLAYAKVITNYPLSPEVHEAVKGLERLATKR